MLILIRHAESEGNANCMAYLNKKDEDIDLTNNGEVQALKFAQDLAMFLDQKQRSNFKCFTSTHLRAKKTAKPFIDFYGLQAVEEPALVERNWGDLRIKVANKEHSDIDFEFFNRPKNGESFLDLYSRVLSFLLLIRKFKKEEDTIIVFTHGEWIKMAYQVWGQMGKGFIFDKEQFKNWKIPNCGFVTLT